MVRAKDRPLRIKFLTLWNSSMSFCFNNILFCEVNECINAYTNVFIMKSTFITWNDLKLKCSFNVNLFDTTETGDKVYWLNRGDRITSENARLMLYICNVVSHLNIVDNLFLLECLWQIWLMLGNNIIYLNVLKNSMW